jgi:tetratricopeptide (TPR) repeat protein
MSLAWLLLGVVIFQQTKLVVDYLDLATGFGLRGAPGYRTPFGQAYPAFAADAQVWVRHAVNLVEGDDLQLRHTTIDNAPNGREVHWNSAWAWTIAGAGKLYQLISGRTFYNSIELATRWLAPAMMWILMVGVSAWTAKRAGLIAGLVVAAALGCKDRINEGFFPSYVDHHGLLTVAAFACLLGATLMGMGWWRPAGGQGETVLLPGSVDDVRRAAIFSALAGAAGMWVSAASVITAIALTGAGGLAAFVVQQRWGQDRTARFDAQAWRLWGRVGAAGSAFFYLVEYFPSHMGLRLEANHPLYSLAWLGGGEVIAQVCERWSGPAGRRWERPERLLWPLGLILLPALVIAVGRASVFVVSDPFLARLHSEYIQEFQPLWTSFKGLDTKSLTLIVLNDFLPLGIGLAVLAVGRGRLPAPVWGAMVAAMGLTALGCLQARWLLNGSAAQIPVVLLLIGLAVAWAQARWRWVVAAALTLAVFAPATAIRYANARDDVIAKRVSTRDANSMLFRDIADTVRRSQPTGQITVLSSPNTSTGVGYYGNFRTLGTLYWENNDGLKSAAAILSARSEDEAAALIRKHGVTHLVMVAEENFIPQYYELLHPGSKQEDMRQCFGYRVMYDKAIPRWLEVLPYAVPPDLKTLKPQVLLFKVNFDQSELEAFYHIAQAQIAVEELDAAEVTLDRVIKMGPDNPQPWLRKAEIQMTRKNWAEGKRLALESAARTSRVERRPVILATAEQLYRNGEHRLAAETYLSYLKEGPDVEMTAYLVWILATSKDDTVRDPANALRLAQELVQVEPTAMNLSILAAAQAENRRFADAAQTIEKSLELGRKIGVPQQLMEVLQQRAKLIREGKPIRE